MLARLVFRPKFVNLVDLILSLRVARGSTCYKCFFASRFNSMLECIQLKGHEGLFEFTYDFLTYNAPLLLFFPEFKTVKYNVRA